MTEATATSAWWVTASWAAPIPMRFARSPVFRPAVPAGAQGGLRARRRARSQAFAAQWGYASVGNRLAQAGRAPDIDLIDIASPNDTHAEIAIAAAQAGKMVMCEKPLGRNAAESERMVEAVEKAGVPNMVWYNYRRVPAVTLAKQLIDEGRLGRIFHYRAQVPAGLDHFRGPAAGRRRACGGWMSNVAGSGVTGDLLAHCIDTAHVAERRHRPK